MTDTPDWDVRPLRTLVRSPISYGVVQTGDHTEGVPCVRVVDLSKETLSPAKMIKTSQEIHRQYARTHLEADDIMMALRGDIGLTRLVPGQLVGANLTRGIARIAPDSSAINPEFLAQALASTVVQRDLWRRTNGSALREIPIGALNRVNVPVPPEPVQLAIAKISRTERAFETDARTLLRRLRARRKSLAFGLLTGKHRFPKFKRLRWTEARLGEIVCTASRPVEWSDEHEYRLASVRRWGGGVFDRGRLLGRDIKVKSLFTIHTDNILVSHIQAAYGAIARVSSAFDGAHVSSTYSVLDAVKDRTLPEYLGHLFGTKWMWHQAYLASNGFFAERLRLCFNETDFLHRRVKIPDSLDEQATIAATLTAADQEIEILEKLRKSMAIQNRGIMQGLMKGEVRIPDAMLRRLKSEIAQRNGQIISPVKGAKR